MTGSSIKWSAVLLVLLVLLAGPIGCRSGITPIRTAYNKGV